MAIVVTLALVSISGCQPDAVSGKPRVASQSPANAESPGESGTGDVPTASASAGMQAGAGLHASHRDRLAVADDVAALGDVQALTLAALLRDSALQGAEYETTTGPDQARKRMDDKVREWLDDAQRRAPDDTTLLVLAIYLERYEQARRQSLVARWRALEPRNLAPLLYETLPEEALFEAAMTTSVYDSHYDDVLRLIIDTLSRASSSSLARLRAATPGQSQEELATSIAITFWAVAGLPAFQRVTTPCRAGTLDDARRLECRWIASVLLHRSDTVISEAIGAGLIARGLGSPAEQDEARRYKREGDWLATCIGQIEQRNPRMLARRFAQLIRGGMQTSERMVMRQIVVEAGFPPSPPTSWQRASR